MLNLRKTAHLTPCCTANHVRHCSTVAANLRRKWQRRRALLEGTNGTNEILFVYSQNVYHGLAARLDEQELSDVIASNEVAKVTPNCLIQLGPEEVTSESAPSARSTFAGVANQENPPSWGLDRIDARFGLDDNYTHGTADGSGTVVYVLDTGVRISHTDFGGRAQAGWAAGCQTGYESLCGSDYFLGGDVDATCSGHGTHCASTIAGKDYGVAKAATVVAVQVLSCQGSGSMAGVLAGIDWSVQESNKHAGKSVISMSLGGTRSDEENNAVANAHAVSCKLFGREGVLCRERVRDGGE